MYQKMIILGNLGNDPVLKYTPAGQAVTNFSVATNNTYKGKDGNLVKETTWFRVSVWGNQAESCNNFLRSGSKVLIEGRMTVDKDTGGPRIFQKNDGTHSANYEITANVVKFLDSREDSPQQSNNAQDDLPF